MTRRIVSIVVLFALTALQAVPLAGSLCAAAPNCCTGTMCPMLQKARAASEHARPDHMDCAGAAKSYSGSQWTGCPCAAQDDHAVGLGFYLLPLPQVLHFARIASPVCRLSQDIHEALSPSLDPPPPRTLDA